MPELFIVVFNTKNAHGHCSQYFVHATHANREQLTLHTVSPLDILYECWIDVSKKRENRKTMVVLR
jgi:hypothetical protein